MTIIDQTSSKSPFAGSLKSSKDGKSFIGYEIGNMYPRGL